MNTLNKVTNLMRDIRNNERTIKTLTERFSEIQIKQRRLDKRLSILEDSLIDSLQEAFEGEDGILSEIKSRIAALEDKK